MLCGKYNATVRGNEVELVDKSVNKYYALEYLSRKQIINFDNLLYFGDDYNDMMVFDRLSNTVATDNAVEDIKQKAKYLTASCDENGVYRFLVNHMFSNISKK